MRPLYVSGLGFVACVLSGCAEMAQMNAEAELRRQQQEIAARQQQLQLDRMQCEGYGLSYGTRSFAGCMTDLNSAREQAIYHENILREQQHQLDIIEAERRQQRADWKHHERKERHRREREEQERRERRERREREEREHHGRGDWERNREMRHNPPERHEPSASQPPHAAPPPPPQPAQAPNPSPAQSNEPEKSQEEKAKEAVERWKSRL